MLGNAMRPFSNVSLIDRQSDFRLYLGNQYTLGEESSKDRDSRIAFSADGSSGTDQLKWISAHHHHQVHLFSKRMMTVNQDLDKIIHKYKC
jgi:hypothetical protein